MTVRVKVAKNDFGRIASRLPVASRVILGKRGVEMINAARRRTPIDTGNLIQGWQLDETNTGVALVNDVEYAAPVEYGHRTRNGGHVAAVPMARPAAEEVFPKIRQDFENLEEHIRP